MTIVAVLIVGVLIFAYMAIQPAVPPPDESRRVKHPGGFSIIIPPDWEKQTTFFIGGTGVDGITSNAVVRSGLPALLAVTRLQAPLTEGKLSDMHFVHETFDQKPIWVKRSDREKSHQHTINYALERDGDWYEITIALTMSEPIEGAPWTDYVRSFHVEKPSTRPAAG